MLKLINIRKEYVTGDLHQVALDNVSINFRSPGLVAILGPSGGGKSTLLNIIGGLDRYDEGDLIIDEVSTKEYTDQDWDSYRNHTIGFVFQSYNLIPHQTILSNVELALTISGIGLKERKERAMKALEEVGLADQAHKKPNQMSGGQVQRVAVARALVNDPDIVLADEPTGALDTKTSIQIMELLKKISKKKLVIMVTHNPDLAETYATRTVRLQDGKIISDSRKARDDKKEAHHDTFGRASMSFLTSLGLSFNNLKTKKWRTILTAFAGSIGIIGIALILSLSNGANMYIRNVQEEALAQYPLSIYETGMDLTSLLTESMGFAPTTEEIDEKVRETQLLESFLSGTKTNDLKSLKEYIDGSQEIAKDVRGVEYYYPINPLIYKQYSEDDIRQINPDTTFNKIGGSAKQMATILSMTSTNVTQFNVLPKNEEIYINQYELLAGRWPENEKELIMMLSLGGTTTDYSLYLAGLKDIKELDELVDKYANGETLVFDRSDTTYDYKDFLGIEYRLINPSAMYEYDSERGIYVDKSSNKDWVKSAYEKADVLTIVGVVMPDDDHDGSIISPGVGYTYELVEYIMNQTKESKIVQAQLANPEVNVFTGKEFGEENDPFKLEDIFSINEEEMANAFGFDFSVLDLSSESFKGIDYSDVQFDINTNELDLSSLSDIDFTLLLKDINVKVNYPGLREAFADVTNGYVEWAKQDPATNYSRLASSVREYMSSSRAHNIIRAHVNNYFSKLKYVLPTSHEIKELNDQIAEGFIASIADKEITSIAELTLLYRQYMASDEVQGKIDAFADMIAQRYDANNMSDDDIAAIANDLHEDYEAYARENDLPQPSKLIDSFQAYIQTAQGKEVFNAAVRKAVNVDEITNQLQSNIVNVMSIYTSDIEEFMAQMMEGFTSVLATKISSALEGVVESMQNVFYFNKGAFANAINVNMDSDSLTELMMSMATTGNSSYANNLKTLNYGTEDSPNSIAIYPIDFDAKNRVVKVLDEYNDNMKKAGEEEKVVTYSDTVAALMNSVTKIVDTISSILIAFVAVSLIVSSIMIGIITYISVLERTKEIGILRALGASKKNISQVFNAETFIIGLLAGVIGIIISFLITQFGNFILHEVMGKDLSAVIPVSGAIVLIILSVILTYIGGLIPSKAAANKDPVEALRTE